MSNNSNIGENYKRVDEKVREAEFKSGRNGEVRVMAVTKTVSVSKIAEVYSLGINLFGENKVQEFAEKHPFYPKNSEIHFIGGLQNNKVKYIIDKVTLIQSVDSMKLAGEINSRAECAGKVMDILVEVNIGGEASKHGFFPDRLYDGCDGIAALAGIRIRGLMVIPPPAGDDGNRKYFEKAKKIFDGMKERYKSPYIDTLSMGMSDDYETAILCGSNLIRLGKALFGPR